MITHDDPANLPESSVDDQPSDHMLEAYCPRCNHAVDAVCPNCQTHVEPAGANIQENSTPAERYRLLFSMLKEARNTKFMLECYSIATGDAFASGLSMEQVAKAWSVGRATVSKQCVWLCETLGIPPSRYMRTEVAREKYRNSNRRPRK